MLTKSEKEKLLELIGDAESEEFQEGMESLLLIGGALVGEVARRRARRYIHEEL